MAITFESVADSSAITPSSGVVTFAATVAGDFLVVSGFARDDTIASVTWNGVSMTKDKDILGLNGLYASVWSLATPDQGTHDVVITSISTSPTYLAGVAISLLGVLPTGALNDTDSIETNSADPAFSALTTTVDGCAVIDAVATNISGSGPVMNSETNRVERANFLALATLRGVACSSIIAKSPSGAVTMGWQIFGGNNSAYVGAAYAPAAPNKVGSLLLMYQ